MFSPDIISTRENVPPKGSLNMVSVTASEPCDPQELLLPTPEGNEG